MTQVSLPDSQNPSPDLPPPQGWPLWRRMPPLPEMPRDWNGLLESLGEGSGKHLRDALRGIAGEDRGALYRDAFHKAWDGFLSTNNLPDLGEWPPNLSGIRDTVLEWARAYRSWEAGHRFKPAKTPQEDWRFKIALWIQADHKGERPTIQTVAMACPLIPKWVSGQTYLTLLPSYGVSLPTPAVVHFSGPVQVLPFREPLRLQGMGWTQDVESLEIMGAAPEPTPEGKTVGPREWILRYAHHQRAVWNVQETQAMD